MTRRTVRDRRVLGSRLRSTRSGHGGGRGRARAAAGAAAATPGALAGSRRGAVVRAAAFGASGLGRGAVARAAARSGARALPRRTPSAIGAVALAPCAVAARLARSALDVRCGRRRLQPSLDALRDVEVAEQVRRRRVGLDRLGLAELEAAVDERPLVHVGPVDERDRDAGLAGAAGAAGAVQVGVGVVGDGVVDHVRDVVDVDAARGDIGRDQDVLLAGLERGHGALALLLVEVAVHGGGVEAAVVELFDQLRGGALRAREDDGACRGPRPAGCGR